MEQQIIGFIKEYDKTCGDDFGVTKAQIRAALETTEEEVAEALNSLYQKKLIIIRHAPGIGKIIFNNY